MKTCKLVPEEHGHVVSIEGMTGRWKRLITTDDTDGVMASGVGYLNQGEGRGWHTHPEGEEEVLHIFQGTALVEWKDRDGTVQRAEAKTGTAIYTPGGVENNISNPYPEMVHCAFCIRMRP